ncbi:MAG: hypothetical protein IJS96_00715 [Schwartzia sp.]|nr:hypothetical protein [Schwartzia sp. (in: firmicutes)]
MKIFMNSTAYILAPAETASGGPELLHQLASYLLRRGVDARMYYVPHDVPDPVPAAYRKYHLPVADGIIDRPENLLVMPEGMELFPVQHIRRIFWWLSVDTWLSHTIKVLLREREGDLLAQPFPRCFYFQTDIPLTHWVQSEYARRFLLLNGVPKEKIHYVSDYLNPVFLAQSGKSRGPRQDIVAYNPLKGEAFTRALTAAAPDIGWRPIKNMSPREVRELLQSAKVYIDFGHHPGKDRIPREAAVSGCCIITGRLGAAGNEIDVPIPEEFKFADREENIPAILEKIRYLLAHYEEASPKFDAYREKIRQEPAQFAKDVDAALTYHFSPRRGKRTALLPLNEKGVCVWREARAMPEFDIRCFVDAESAGTERRDGAAVLPVISDEDAAFLYQEKRIEQFLFYADSQAEQQALRERLDRMGIEAPDRLEL